MGKRWGRGRLITASGKIFEQEWKEVENFDGNNKGPCCVTTQITVPIVINVTTVRRNGSKRKRISYEDKETDNNNKKKKDEEENPQ